MSNVAFFVLDRLKERSTWLGFSGFFTSLGYYFTDVELDAMASIGVAVSSFVYAMFPETQSVQIVDKTPRE